MIAGTVLGIDFGTSHSSIAGCVGDRVRCCADGGELRVPSVVHVPAVGDLVVGSSALSHAATDPGSTAVGIKRLLGRSADGPAGAALRAGTVHRIVRGDGGAAQLTLRGEIWSPIQLVSAVLGHLRQRAIRVFGEGVRDVVMTAPVASSAEYLAALSRAATMAGLSVRRFVAEPIAALVAVGAHLVGEGSFLVCDFGGGTFDCTVARWDGRLATPVASDGDDFLGGDDFDLALAEGVASDVFTRHQLDLHHDRVGWGRLVRACEHAKRQLSSSGSGRVVVRSAYSAGGRYHDLDTSIDRLAAELRWAPLVDRAGTAMLRTLRRAAIEPDQLAGVVLVGGTSQIPMVQRRLAALLGREAKIAPNADLAVVSGAALIGTLVDDRRALGPTAAVA